MSIQPVPPSSAPTTAGQLAARATQNDQILAAALSAAEDRITALESDSDTSGSSNLLVVSGSVTLDNSLPVGTLVGYRATASTTFTGQGGSVALAAGAHIFERVTGGWTYRTIDEGTNLTTGPPETTPPVAGTLAVTGVTHNAATLTVSGASDNQQLHGAPYAFSTNNGTTWTGWQTSNVYAASGLTPSTSYTFRHKVRDASGNEATGTAVTQATAAGPPPSLPFTDDFTAPDGTALIGRSVGGFTWVSGSGWSAPSIAPLTIQGNQLAHPGGTALGTAYIDAGAAHVRVSARLVIPTGTSAQSRIALGDHVIPDTAMDGAYIFVTSTQAKVYRGVGGSGPVQIGTTQSITAPFDGVVSLEYDGATVTAKIGGATVVSEAVSGLTGTNKAGIVIPADVVADDFTVEAL